MTRDKEAPVSTSPKGARLHDRDLINRWGVIHNFTAYSKAIREKYPVFPAEADAGIGFIYVDYHCGISLKIEYVASNPHEGAVLRQEDLKNPGVSLTFRYIVLKDLMVEPMKPEQREVLGLPPAPAWHSLYEPADLAVVREFTWLDPFRAPGFFDDVMATLPRKEGHVPELIWVRLSRFMPGKNRFSAILLNEPFRDYGVHRNDPVEIQVVTGTDGTRTLAILLPRDNPAGSSTSQDKNSFSEMG